MRAVATIALVLQLQLAQSRLLRIAGRTAPGAEAPLNTSEEQAVLPSLNASVGMLEKSETSICADQLALVEWGMFNSKVSHTGPKDFAALRIDQSQSVSAAIFPVYLPRSFPGQRTRPSPRSRSSSTTGSTFRINTNLKLLEPPRAVTSLALVVRGSFSLTVSNRSKSNSRYAVKKTKVKESKMHRLQELSVSLVKSIMQPGISAKSATCSAALVPVPAKPSTKKQGKSQYQSQSSSSTGKCTRWLCSCVPITLPAGTEGAVATQSAAGSCSNQASPSATLQLESPEKTALQHRQQKATARMYKQARQLRLLKQTLQRENQVDETWQPPRVELQQVPILREQRSCGLLWNLLVAAATFSTLLFASQQTVKPPSPRWCSSWRIHHLTEMPNKEPEVAACELQPVEQHAQSEAHEGSPFDDQAKGSPSEEVEPDSAMHSPSSDDVNPDRDETESSNEAGADTPQTEPCLPGVSDTQDEDAQEESDKLEDQDEVSSVVESCGTSDGYEKLEIGGSIFMDDDEDANGEP
jgi:hypothetical protein